MATLIKVASVAEILKTLEKESDCAVLGGGCGIEKLPPKILCARKIPELKKFEKWDRFFSIGAMTTLSELEDKGKRNLPPLLFSAVRETANRNVRNIATIGGNVLSSINGTCGTLFSPLCALDARLEFVRSKGDIRTETKSVPLSRLSEFNKKGWLLSKIIIPNEEWDVRIFKHLGSEGFLDKDSASFSFLADKQGGGLSAVRIALSGAVKIRSAEFESRLVGSPIPIQKSRLSEIREAAERLFDAQENASGHHLLKMQFLNLLQNALERL